MIKNIFNTIPHTKVGSNTFDLSHDVKLTGDFGTLMPICTIETLPGDNFKISGNAMVRLAPTVAPVMHRADVYIHYFFVPNRIVWPGWEDFITGGRLGTDNTVPPFILIESDSIQPSTLLDYMGIPGIADVGAGVQTQINALAIAAYHKIFNDYYRDQNLTVEVPEQLIDGDNFAIEPSLVTLRNRAWGKDYFTSALPWTQRGPEALLPLGDTAPLEAYEGGHVGFPTFVFQDVRKAPDKTVATTGNLDFDTDDFGGTSSVRSATEGAYIDVSTSHRVDLSAATSSSIIELRRAMRLQEWLEKNAIGGARYVESLQVHFGVHSGDYRLQRAEYIGGMSAPIKMSEVLQTSETGTTPQGTMAGHGISVGGSKYYNYACKEHGHIIGILSVIPKSAYQQGIHKQWHRVDKLDYAWPSFASIGEQPITNRELQWTGNQTVQEETFGYTPRYAEYKFLNNRVCGDFKNTFDFWHMGRKFAITGVPPVLNTNFIEMTAAEVSRIFAVQTTDDDLWMQVINNIKASRKLPVFGTPKM